MSNSVYVGDVKSDGSVEQGANGILYNDGVIDKNKPNEGSNEGSNKGDNGDSSTTTPTNPSEGSDDGNLE